MTPDTQRLQATVSNVDALLTSGRYQELEELTGGIRLKAEHIATAIEEYPGKLTHRPSYDVENMSVVYVHRSDPPVWSVYPHLWRKEGGESDLTAELTLRDTPTGFYAVEIDDIHVL